MMSVIMTAAKHLRRCRRGVIAIEYAIILPVFLPLLLGLVEVSFFYFKAIVLEGAVREATRVVRTGQAQASGDALAMFKDTLCDNLAGVLTCGELSFYVRSGTKFADAVFDPVFNADGQPINQEFTPGAGSAVVTVRVGYQWTFLTPMLGEVLGGDSAKVTMSSTAVFRNEPFE